jgi:hypothetical protein
LLDSRSSRCVDESEIYFNIDKCFRDKLLVTYCPFFFHVTVKGRE